MNKPAVIIASTCLLAVSVAFAAAPAGGMHATPTARPAAPTTQPTTRPTTTSNPRTTQHTTGQPNASCEDTPNQPGNSMSAPGSAFNPDGTAGTHYAGEQPQNSKNPNSVSQYDVACARNRSH